MKDQVKCSVCGREFESTTVNSRSYKKGDQIDFGCPFCGVDASLLAVRSKRGRKPQ